MVFIKGSFELNSNKNNSSRLIRAKIFGSSKKVLNDSTNESNGSVAKQSGGIDIPCPAIILANQVGLLKSKLIIYNAIRCF
jgi:hypothetical protein